MNEVMLARTASDSNLANGPIQLFFSKLKGQVQV